MREAPAAPRPRTAPTARRLRARPTARTYSRRYLLSHSLLRRLEAREGAELVVGQAALERRECLAFAAAGEPASHEPFHRGLEPIARHTPEERAADLRLRAERAAREDVVGRDP